MDNTTATALLERHLCDMINDVSSIDSLPLEFITAAAAALAQIKIARTLERIECALTIISEK